MLTKTDELINVTRQTLGLQDYRLHTCRFRRQVNLLGETVYTLEMEWLPPYAGSPEEDGSNPPGTACVELNVHTRQFESIIFVGGQSAACGLRFSREDGWDVIRWVEKETGLVYGEHFYMRHKEGGKFQFAAGVEGTPVSPSGSVEVELDEGGNLTFYAKYGYFPSNHQVRKEPFSLTLEQVEPIARQQLKLHYVPSQKEERIIPVYALEEIFIRNDLCTTISLDSMIEAPSALKVDETLHWEKPLDQPFQRQEVKYLEEVTPEQAFSAAASPDVNPITQDEQRACKEAVIHFLRQEYPQDSGRWRLETLYRNQGYIYAVLRRSEDERLALKRKLSVIIDSNRFEVLNYIDNLNFLEVFNGWPQVSNVVLTQDEAYDQLKDNFTLTPAYVLDPAQKLYRLCGKLDCAHAVQAETGQLISLEDI